MRGSRGSQLQGKQVDRCRLCLCLGHAIGDTALSSGSGLALLMASNQDCPRTVKIPTPWHSRRLQSRSCSCSCSWLRSSVAIHPFRPTQPHVQGRSVRQLASSITPHHTDVEAAPYQEAIYTTLAVARRMANHVRGVGAAALSKHECEKLGEGFQSLHC